MCLHRKAIRQFALCTLQFSIFSVLLCLIAALVISANAQSPQQDIEVIRTQTDLTNLLFTATDKNNRYLTTLRQEDIRVLEDGVPQTLFTFQRETDRPLAIAFLIDVSISEQRTLPEEKAAAREFIESVIRSSKDQAAIIPFEGYAHLEQPLTNDMGTVYRTLGSIEAAIPFYTGTTPPLKLIPSPRKLMPPSEGSTAIWDAIALTCRSALGNVSTQRLRTIILLTDGRDTSSRLSRSAAIDEAIKSDTIVYAIGI